MSRLLGVVFLLGTATVYSLFFFFFEGSSAAMAFGAEGDFLAGGALVTGARLAALAALVWASLSRSAASGARRGSTPTSSEAGSGAAGRIPAQSSEHKGKFGT